MVVYCFPGVSSVDVGQGLYGLPKTLVPATALVPMFPNARVLLQLVHADDAHCGPTPDFLRKDKWRLHLFEHRENRAIDDRILISVSGIQCKPVIHDSW